MTSEQNQQVQMKNVYLDEVLEKQQRVEHELRAPAAKKIMARGRPAAPVTSASTGGGGGQAPADGGGRVVDYRITGLWRWKTVVVPPNVYVVHTRRGRDKPLHMGLGVSFRFNPQTDAFLVIPAAMQTIVINANCICLERQGILVQAYVQWIIDNIEIAYRRLDFSDPEDPMRVVNVQLREQAEAAIKDKVATLRIDEVLADKQPIIEELTHRLRAVAEGSREGGNSEGLGLRIVTVQIKEAVVSSARLWENLQKPFRAKQGQLARTAELEAEGEIAGRELGNRRSREMAEIDVERELAQLRAAQEREQYDRSLGERGRRHTLEQDAERKAAAERNATETLAREGALGLALKDLEIERRRTEEQIRALEVERRLDAARFGQQRAVAESETALAELRSQAEAARGEREVALAAKRQQVDNDLSDNRLRAQLVEQLPEIAAKLPAPRELRSISISGGGADGGSLASLLGLVAGVLGLLEKQKVGAGKERA